MSRNDKDEEDFERRLKRFDKKPAIPLLKPPRDKKQNVWLCGEMFTLKSSRNVVCRNPNGLFTRVTLHEGILIALSDSDQFLTFQTDVLYLYYSFDARKQLGKVLKDLPAYHLWPFMYRAEVVWLVLSGSEDPVADLRAMGNNVLKRMK